MIAALINTLRPRQNGRHLADDTFNRVFVNENVRISIKFSLKFVPTGPINNIPALVQIMAWRRPGDKPLSEPVMVNPMTHICVTRPQWVKLHLLPVKYSTGFETMLIHMISWKETENQTFQAELESQHLWFNIKYPSMMSVKFLELHQTSIPLTQKPLAKGDLIFCGYVFLIITWSSSKEANGTNFL